MSMFFRLCSRAPRTVMNPAPVVFAMSLPDVRVMFRTIWGAPAECKFSGAPREGILKEEAAF
jgi:hypothetical protein